jgi:putative transposase
LLILTMGLRGRNSLKTETYFFVTTTIVRFQPVFKDDTFCQILIDNIKYYQIKYKFEILAYVIMPTHFHWIIEINPELGKVSDIMRDVKKYSAWQILDEIKLNGNTELERIFEEEAKGKKDQQRKFWMSRFDDEVIRNQKMFWDTLEYIHNNPVKAGLVLRPEDYKYSSARNYIYNDNSIIKVNTERGGINFL